MSESAPVEASAPAAPPPGGVRRWLVPVLKIGLAAGLVWYVLNRKMIDFERLNNLVRAPQWLGLAVLFYSIQLFLGAQRLRILLAPSFVSLSYWSALRLTYLGAVFDIFLVTSVGGDAIKAVYLARETPAGKRTGAVSVLVLDRLLGLLGLLSLTLIVALCSIGVLWQKPELRPYLVGMLGVTSGLILGTMMLLSQRVYQSGPMQAVLKWLPLGGVINRAYGALQGFRDHPRALIKGYLLSVLVHCCTISAGYALMLGLQLSDNVGFASFAVAWLTSIFVSSFAPMGGIGFGQLAYGQIFIAVAGISGGADVATAAQIAPLLAKSPGLLAWLVSREHRGNDVPARNEAA